MVSIQHIANRDANHTQLMDNRQLADKDLPNGWADVRQQLLRNQAIYQQPEKLVHLIHVCAQSNVLRKLILQISLARLSFCRYYGDTACPCLAYAMGKFVVSTYNNDTKYVFTELTELIPFVEASIPVMD